MKFSVKIVRESRIDRDLLYSFSTNLNEFIKLMPQRFKEIKITHSNGTNTNAIEKIGFLGFQLSIKTKHQIIHPNTHQIYFLSGPLKGTSFLESYEKIENGTRVSIEIVITLIGFSKLLILLKSLITKKMSSITDEFLLSVESRVTQDNSILIQNEEHE